MTQDGTNDMAQASTTRKRGFFSARFMRSLSVGAKLWSTTGLMALPLAGLATFYVHSLSSTLWFTAAEQRGYTLFQPLDQVAQRIVRREELQATAIARRVNAAIQMRRLDEDLELRVAELEQTDAGNGNAATHSMVKDLRGEWTALKAATPATPQDAMTAHEHVLDSIAAISTQVSSDWKLALDPELVAYNLIQVSVEKLPDARRFLIESRAHMAAMYDGATYVPTEGAQVVSLIALFSDRMTDARDSIKTAGVGAIDRPALAMQINEMGNDWDNGIAAWAAEVARDLATGHPAESDIRALLDTSAKYSQSLNSTQNSVMSQAATALTLRYDSQLRYAILALTLSGISVLCAMLLMYALSKRIAGAVARLIFITERILQNRHDTAIDEGGTDEISRLFARVNQLQQALAAADRTSAADSDTQVAAVAADAPRSLQNERLGAALDSVSGCVMVADADGKIVYNNAAVQEMLQRAEADIRRQLPRFSAAAVVGADFDIFHHDPQRQSRLLSSLTGAHTAQISIGGRKFRLILNPVNSPDGTRLGTVVEWADRTLELGMEGEVNAMLTAVLAGDLSRRIDVAGKSGFFEALGQGMNRLVDNVQELIAKVKTTSRDVHTAAEELAGGNANLSQRTEQQAASLEQTASSMEEITSTVKQNADNAHQANQLASAAREQAQAGGAVVSQAIAAMADINDSSKKIANIIGVIDEIAFQTNLLALNAAVEAARAGEQGRGFAVVASEVRNLAGRSAAAAKEIKELIRDSVGKVEGGTLLVAQSGQTLEQIVTAVKKVTDVVAEIASASSEQIRGIEQVNNAITHMDEMTQQNAALVEQATAASQAMTEQAGQLTRILDGYQTGNRAGAAARAPRRAAG